MVIVTRVPRFSDNMKEIMKHLRDGAVLGWHTQYRRYVVLTPDDTKIIQKSNAASVCSLQRSFCIEPVKVKVCVPDVKDLMGPTELGLHLLADEDDFQKNYTLIKRFK